MPEVPAELLEKAGIPADIYRAHEPRELGWLDQLFFELAQGTWPINARTLALANALLVKAGPGALFGFSGFSNRGTAQFVQVFDLASLPADGAVPEMIITVPATSNFSASWFPLGRAFTRGCVLCNSSTAATKTIGSADTWFDVQYV